MRILVVATALLLAVGAASPAAAQSTTPGLSTPNPQSPARGVRPTPRGPSRITPRGTFGSRESIPFGDEPHALNNPHPMLPNAGLGYAVRQVWMPPQPVTMRVYVPTPEGVPSRYQTMYAEVPGFYVVE